VEFAGPLAVTIGVPDDGQISSGRCWPAARCSCLAGGTRLRSERSPRPDRRGSGPRLAGTCWAGYIMLSAQTGRRFPGSSGLAVAMVVAAVIILPVGVTAAGARLLRPEVLGLGAVVALLSSALPYSFEALRPPTRHSGRAFGILLSMEPGHRCSGRTGGARSEPVCHRDRCPRARGGRQRRQLLVSTPAPSPRRRLVRARDACGRSAVLTREATADGRSVGRKSSAGRFRRGMAGTAVPGLAVGVRRLGCSLVGRIWPHPAARPPRRLPPPSSSVQSTSEDVPRPTCVLRASRAGVLLQERPVRRGLGVPCRRNFEVISNLGIDLAVLRAAAGRSACRWRVLPGGELFTPLQLDRTTFHMRRIATRAQPCHRPLGAVPPCEPLIARARPHGACRRPYTMSTMPSATCSFTSVPAKDPSRTRCWKSPTASVSRTGPTATATGWAWRAAKWGPRNRGLQPRRGLASGSCAACSGFQVSLSVRSLLDQLPRSRPATGGLAGDRQVARAGQYAPDLRHPVARPPPAGRQAPSLQTRGRAPCREYVGRIGEPLRVLVSTARLIRRGVRATRKARLVGSDV